MPKPYYTRWPLVVLLSLSSAALAGAAAPQPIAPPRDAGRAAPSAGTLPELIRLSGNAALVAAWREVELALQENEKLPRPLPEPLFARAEIWSAVNNYDAALQDYLTAMKLARQSGEDLASYSSYFLKLQELLDKLNRVPKPATLGAGKDYFFLAKDHFSAGFHAFWRGDLRAALDRFDSAIQLQPEESLYWYYRALTFKRLGDDRRAVHDVLLAAHLEQQRETRYGRRLDTALARVQGGLRQWLQGYRLGDPTQHILRETLEFGTSPQPRPRSPAPVSARAR